MFCNVSWCYLVYVLFSLKISDSCWDGEGECPDELLAFSDDEEERRYMAKKRRARAGGSFKQNEGCLSVVLCLKFGRSYYN